MAKVLLGKMKFNDINERFIGKYLTYPKLDDSSNKFLEGGMRLEGLLKKSYAGLPLVTVITTIYNRESVVERAMCSVFQQSYPNIEYILVDAGSTDGTLSIIDKYSDKIDYYISQSDTGIYDGINKGLELSIGDYIIVLNSDDWYEKTAIEQLLKAVIEKNLDYVSALAIETDWFGNAVRKIPMMPYNDLTMLRMPLRHETMLVARNLYRQVGLYDTSYKIIGDLKMTQQFFNTDRKFNQLNSYIMYFRNTGVASKLSDSFIIERRRLLSENFEYLEEFEIKILADDFKGDPIPYYDICHKYSSEKKINNAIMCFLQFHGF